MSKSSAASDKPRAQVVMERYWEEVNNQGKLELIRELCANPITRHDPGEKTTELTHDEQIARVEFGIEKMGVKITNVIVHADDTTVTGVWNMTMKVEGKDVAMCGIEVFQLDADGRLADCWNAPYGEGHWG